jgi:hypothetical protein
VCAVLIMRACYFFMLLLSCTAWVSAQCPPGEYLSQAASAGCVECPADYACPGCLPAKFKSCPQVQVVPEVWVNVQVENISDTYSTMYPCPTDSTSPTGSSMCTSTLEGNQLVCYPGTTFTDENCAPCPAGKTCNYVSSNNQPRVPADCDLGTYSSPGWAVCEVCKPGFYPNPTRTECVPCEANTYAADYSKRATCTPCLLGYHASPGASNCIEGCAGGAGDSGGGCATCTNGTSSEGGGTCSECAADSYATTSASTCTDCPLGSHTNGQVGQTSCAYCASGYYYNTLYQSCLTCPAGTFSNYIPDQTIAQCDYCPSGQSSGKGATACIDCGTGFVSPDGSECHYCNTRRHAFRAAGKGCDCSPNYRLSADGLHCEPCMVGSYRLASMSPDVCAYCPPGTFGANRLGVCKRCPFNWGTGMLAGVGPGACSAVQCKSCLDSFGNISKTEVRTCSSDSLSTVDGPCLPWQAVLPGQFFVFSF